MVVSNWEAGPHPDVDGVTGKTIVLRFEKTFGRIERFFAKLMKAPRNYGDPFSTRTVFMGVMQWTANLFRDLPPHERYIP